MSEIVGRLQSEFSLMTRGQGLGHLAAVLNSLKAGQCARNALMECTANRQLVLNPNHPVLAKLGRIPEPTRWFFLLSAIVSVVNRADQEIRDEDERRFHALLLERLGEATPA